MAKLRVARFLGNPKPRKKKKPARKKAQQRSRKRLQDTQTKKTVVRAIIATSKGYTHKFWGGGKWTSRSFAKRYSGTVPAPEVAKIRRKLPAGWVSLDALPA